MVERVIGYFFILTVSSNPSILEILAGVLAIAVLLYILSLFLGKKVIENDMPNEPYKNQKLDFKQKEEKTINNIKEVENNKEENSEKIGKGDTTWKTKF